MNDEFNNYRRSTSIPQKNWSLLRQKFVPASKGKTIEESRRQSKERAANVGNPTAADEH